MLTRHTAEFALKSTGSSILRTDMETDQEKLACATTGCCFLFQKNVPTPTLQLNILSMNIKPL